MDPTSFLGFASPGAIDEDVSHRHGRDAEEVCPIAPVVSLGAGKLEIELVHERGRRQRIARTIRELATRGASELVVDEWEYLIEGFASTAPKISEQLRDARAGIQGRGRTFDRALRVYHCNGSPNVDGVRRRASSQIEGSDCCTCLSVEAFVAND